MDEGREENVRPFRTFSTLILIVTRVVERTKYVPDEPMTIRILGWFIDNELRWGSDWRGSDELLTYFLGWNGCAGSHGGARLAARALSGFSEV